MILNHTVKRYAFYEHKRAIYIVRKYDMKDLKAYFFNIIKKILSTFMYSAYNDNKNFTKCKET
ncbi:hypothetical protein ACVWZB_001787 [Paenibacillus polymyxa]|jgi:hypothetical protein|nr:hypothetical protein TY89_02055 [Paenibacillus polymyxa]PTU46502.1 hypothetical protein DBL67_13465 [Paenibacillus polymyxa]SPY16994.1 Uncharacterised protein [Paenibacillus polymyxa]